MKIMFKHRVLAFAMAMVMLCSLLPVSVFAEDGHDHCVCSVQCGEVPNAACPVCAADGECSPTAPADPVAPVAEEGETGGGNTCICTTKCTSAAYNTACPLCYMNGGFVDNCEICDHGKHGYSDCGQCMVIAIDNFYGFGYVETAQHMKSCYDKLSEAEKAYVSAEYVEKLNQMVAGTDVNTGGNTDSCSHNFSYYVENNVTVVQYCATCETRNTKTIAGFNDHKGFLMLDGEHQQTADYTQVITYSKNGDVLSGVPTDPGTYLVEVTICGVTAAYSFTIAHVHAYTYKDDVPNDAVVVRDYTCGCEDVTMTMVYQYGAVDFNSTNYSVWSYGREEMADYTITIKNANGGEVPNGQFADGSYTATATYTDKAINATASWTLNFTVGESSGGDQGGDTHTHSYQYAIGDFDFNGTYKEIDETCTVEGCEYKETLTLTRNTETNAVSVSTTQNWAGGTPAVEYRVESTGEAEWSTTAPTTSGSYRARVTVQGVEAVLYYNFCVHTEEDDCALCDIKFDLSQGRYDSIDAFGKAYDGAGENKQQVLNDAKELNAAIEALSEEDYAILVAECGTERLEVFDEIYAWVLEVLGENHTHKFTYSGNGTDTIEATCECGEKASLWLELNEETYVATVEHSENWTGGVPAVQYYRANNIPVTDFTVSGAYRAEVVVDKAVAAVHFVLCVHDDKQDYGSCKICGVEQFLQGDPAYASLTAFENIVENNSAYASSFYSDVKGIMAKINALTDTQRGVLKKECSNYDAFVNEIYPYVLEQTGEALCSKGHTYDKTLEKCDICAFIERVDALPDLGENGELERELTDTEKTEALQLQKDYQKFLPNGRVQQFATQELINKMSALILAAGGTVRDPGRSGSFSSTDGDWTYDYTYTETETTLTLNGSGALNAGAASAAPWAGYADSINTIVINGEVTSVGEGMLTGANLTTVWYSGEKADWVDGITDIVVHCGVNTENIAAHFSTEKETVAATCTTAGKIVYTCACTHLEDDDRIREEALNGGALAEHTFTWWGADDTHHWKRCSKCSTPDDTTKEEHDFTHVEANPEDDTQHTYSCWDCDRIAKQENHSFTQQVVKDEYKNSDATCSAFATYFKSCVCGAKGTETFVAGEMLPHTVTYVAEVPASCTESGTKAHYLCTECKNVAEDETFEKETHIGALTIPAAHKPVYRGGLNVSTITENCEKCATHCGYANLVYDDTTKQVSVGFYNGWVGGKDYTLAYTKEGEPVDGICGPGNYSVTVTLNGANCVSSFTVTNCQPHTFSYTAKDNVITQTCSTCGNVGTLTINGYDDILQMPQLPGKGILNDEENQTSVVFYKNGVALEGKPTTEGEHTMKVTLGGVTAEKVINVDHIHAFEYKNNGTSAITRDYTCGCDDVTMSLEYNEMGFFELASTNMDLWMYWGEEAKEVQVTVLQDGKEVPNTQLTAEAEYDVTFVYQNLTWKLQHEITHPHEFTYTRDMAAGTLTRTCSVENCRKNGTITLVHNPETNVVTVERTGGWTETLAVEYCVAGTEQWSSTVPTKSGTHQARVVYNGINDFRTDFNICNHGTDDGSCTLCLVCTQLNDPSIDSLDAFKQLEERNSQYLASTYQFYVSLQRTVNGLTDAQRNSVEAEYPGRIAKLKVVYDYIWAKTCAVEHTPGNLIAEVPAVCDTPGTKAHYMCQICQARSETTDFAQIVTLEDLVIAHGHTLQYAASGNVLTETCGKGCDHSATATLTYTGGRVAGSVKYTEKWLGGELTINYTGTDYNSTTAPDKEGTFTATINKGEVSATAEGVNAHIHLNTYSGSGNVITETCAGEKDCGHEATVTVKYEGGRVAGTVEYSDNWKGEKDLVITYTGTGSYNSTTAPTKEGTYTATISVGNTIATATGENAHIHVYTYAGSGAVIAETCIGDIPCSHSETATVVYTGGRAEGSVTYSEGWQGGKDLAIVYRDADGKEVSGYPTKEGTYTATISKENAVAVATGINAHEHKYTYTANGSTLTESCTGDIPCGHNLKATVSYPGNGQAATVIIGTGWLGGELTVNYTGTNNYNSANVPTAEGEYTATITKDGVSASAKATVAHVHSLTVAAGADGMLTQTCSCGHKSVMQVVHGADNSIGVTGSGDEWIGTVPTMSLTQNGVAVDTVLEGTYKATLTVGTASSVYEFYVPHAHKYTYTASGDTLTQTCAGLVPCGREAKAQLVYNESNKYVDINYIGGAWDGDDVGVPAVEYFAADGTKLDAAPMKEGSYIAKITAGEKTAVLNYSVAHEHVLAYAADGAVITETCAAEKPCNHTATATVVYDGYVAAAALQYSGWLGGKVYTVNYTGGDNYNNTTAPTAGGSYTATVTWGEYTVSTDFSIVSMVVAIPTENAEGSAVELATTQVAGLGELAAEEAKTIKDNETVTVTVAVDYYDASTSSDAEKASIDTMQTMVNGSEDAAANKPLEVIEIDVKKKTLVETETEEGGTTTEEKNEVIAETAAVLEIKVPYNFENKMNIKVYRSHQQKDGTYKVEPFTALTTGRATAPYTDKYFYADEANDCIWIYSQQFSAFGITNDAATEVTFNDNNGNTYTEKFPVGVKTTISDIVANPTRTGYKFDGWYKDAACTGAVWEELTVGSTSFTLYAKWTPEIYTLTFNADNGTEATTQSVTYGQAIGTLPTAPTKPGYTFDGWYLGDTKLTAETVYEVAGPSTITAQWTANTSTLTFDAGSGTVTPATKTVTYGQPMGELPVPTMEGKVFDGWYTDSDCTEGNLVDAATEFKGTADATLYAKWADGKYTATYEANGGTVSPASKDVTYGQSYGELATPTKPGYQFKGWFADQACTTPVTAETEFETTADVFLYAKWEAILYTVTLDANGGTIGGKATSTIDNVVYGSEYGALDTPVKNGWDFVGWYLGDTEVKADTKVATAENHTLTAKWITYTMVKGDGQTAAPGDAMEFRADAPFAKFKDVRVDNDVLVKDTDYTVKEGSIVVTLSADYTKTLNEGSHTITVLLTDGKEVPANFEVKAKAQTQVKVQVTFNANGGTTPTVPQKEVTVGGTYGSLPTSTKEGLYFTGWYTAKDGGTRIYETTTVTATTAHTLYAHWSTVPPTGDAVSAAQTLTLAGAMTLSLAALAVLAIYKKKKS